MSEPIENAGSEGGEAVLAMFQRAADFTQQLLNENQRLRLELSEVHMRHGQAAQSDSEWGKLRHELIGKIEELENENETILLQLRSVEGDNHHFAERYVEVEEENNNLANLYVASYQLHSTLDPHEVVRIILEVVINLVGAEVFCVYVCEEGSDELQPVACEGDKLSAFPTLRVGEGLVGKSIESGTVSIREQAEKADFAGAEGDKEASLGLCPPIVSIPLCVEDRPVGAIVIHELLQQKDGFSALDNELFSLLAGHASTAIFASKLYAASERKLNTIQEFIDLLTK